MTTTRCKAAITDKIAAILVEPVQGEGGIRPLAGSCLKGLRDLCDEHGILLILDEVQCGMGRTGKLFAHEWAGIDARHHDGRQGHRRRLPAGRGAGHGKRGLWHDRGHPWVDLWRQPAGLRRGLRSDGRSWAIPAFLAEVNRKAGMLRQKLEGLVAAHPDVFEAVRGSGLMLGLKCKAAQRRRGGRGLCASR